MRRLLALAALVLLAVAAVAGGRELSEGAPRAEFRPRATGFGLAGVDRVTALDRARQQRSFQAVVTEGDCSRFIGFRFRVTSNAITAWAEMREKIPPPGAACPAKAFERRTTLTLPEAVGDRALIIYAGPYEFRTLVIPPAGREAVRALLLPIRRGDRRQPPPLTYGSAVCDAVDRYIRDVPRRDRC
ncbi:hypothetical protein OJ997_06930 [Solirubrobacter phytolaccae]|uniref:Uncharacterized protein n=1 Tax=Solirubrobacter phytolaccae TaxID=1404360 RepID=A0A9X3N5C2_9ACTN|nr:hypothetical protein [Solirubrobacter phytolaccae]MDA0180023.1 hypothetical protein [Solirubrobacter phytolaccae]